MAWDRRLWGVELTGSDGKKLSILGTRWDRPPSYYFGEPTRPLLFTSRVTCRVWCRAKQATYVGRVDGCQLWRFRPIRVRETLRALVG